MIILAPVGGWMHVRTTAQGAEPTDVQMYGQTDTNSSYPTGSLGSALKDSVDNPIVIVVGT